MKEYSRLGDSRLLEVFGTAVEHHLSDFEAKNLICPVEEAPCLWAVLIKVPGHSRELSPLAWENVCSH